jgi:crossover junction endodeoxyribonuclease RuvC
MGIVILGIDPGLQRTGWGLIASKDNQLSFIDCGTIKSVASVPLDVRLKQLHDGIASVIKQHAPHEAAIEETFVSISGSSTLKLGQARGALMLTLSLHHLPVCEYSATMVKKSVVGSGHADKAQIGMMVGTLLPTSKSHPGMKSADAADALAIAICHAHQRTMNRLTAGSKS